MTTAGASPDMFLTAFCKKYNACGMPFFFCGIGVAVIFFDVGNSHSSCAQRAENGVSGLFGAGFGRAKCPVGRK